VVDRQTESFFVAFTRARHAVAAAADAQRALDGHAWPDAVEVRVRMGVHAGEPEVDGDRYVGLDVSRAARICGAAHGGQVLVSSSARSLLGDDERAALRELGSYRLKDFPAPEPISQLAVEGVPERFPAIRAERTRSRHRRVVLAAVALLVVVAGAAAVAALATRGSSGLTAVAPTSLGVIDPASNRIVDEIPLGFKSRLIAAGKDYVWVADPAGSTLRRIGVRSREVEPVGLQTGGLPSAIAVGGGAVWVTALRGDELILIELDPELGDIRGDPLVLARGPSTATLRSPALAVGLGALWILDPASAALRRLDLKTRRLRTVDTDIGDSFALAVGFDSVWIAGSNSVRRIDPATDTSLPPIPLGSAAGASEAAALDLGGDAVWYVASSVDALWRVDHRSNAHASPAAVGQGSAGIAFGENAVWIGNSRDGTVMRVDPASGRTKPIELGTGRGGVAVTHGLVWVTPGEPLG
jgi:streptogramin lyase